MSVDIHPTAIVAKTVKLGNKVKIGPYAVLDGELTIEDGVEIGPHAHITGNTIIGQNTKVFTGAALGNPPQDLKYKNEKTLLKIGRNNIIREFVMINPGTKATGQTVIGDNNLLMAYSHVAHDCIIGNNCILANLSTLAGHVQLGNRVVLGGFAGVHQFVKIGDMAIVGGCSKVVQDVPPYAMVDGHPAAVVGINSIGLKRAGVPKESIGNIKKAFDVLFFSGHPFSKGMDIIEAQGLSDSYIAKLFEFIRNSERGICRKKGA